MKRCDHSGTFTPRGLPTVNLSLFDVRVKMSDVKHNFDDDGVRLRVVALCNDIEGRGEIEIAFTNMWTGEVWRALTERERARAILDACVEFMRHELAECLRVDGEQVEDPHKLRKAV